MIIFTVTNTVTNQVYVGSTRNNLDEQWSKMVAAAEQDMDFPLYHDIRRHGPNCFIREIYDMADNRSELAELEQNALQDLDAISLRGHKISNVIIRKKAPVRRNASDAERALLELLDSFATGEINDDPLTEASPPETEQAAKDQNKTRTPAPSSQHKSPVTDKIGLDHNRDNSPATPITAVESVPVTARPPETNAPSAPEVENETKGKPQQPVQIPVQIKAASRAPQNENISDSTQAEHQSTVQPKLRVISAKEQRIIDAIARHREARAKRTSDTLNAERASIKRLYNELNERISAITSY